MLTGAGQVVYSIVGLVVYLYIAYCMQAIAKNLKTPHPWFAWIPVLNVYLWCRVVGKGILWTILLFIPIMDIVFYVIMCFKLARACGRSRPYGLLLLVPLVNFVILWALAFGWESLLGERAGDAA